MPHYRKLERTSGANTMPACYGVVDATANARIGTAILTIEIAAAIVTQRGQDLPYRAAGAGDVSRFFGARARSLAVACGRGIGKHARLAGGSHGTRCPTSGAQFAAHCRVDAEIRLRQTVTTVLDPEFTRIVLDLAHAELEWMQLARPESDGRIGSMAFDEVAAAVEWRWYPPVINARATE